MLVLLRPIHLPTGSPGRGWDVEGWTWWYWMSFPSSVILWLVLLLQHHISRYQWLAQNLFSLRVFSPAIYSHVSQRTQGELFINIYFFFKQTKPILTTVLLKTCNYSEFLQERLKCHWASNSSIRNCVCWVWKMPHVQKQFWEPYFWHLHLVRTCPFSKFPFLNCCLVWKFNLWERKKIYDQITYPYRTDCEINPQF